MLAAYWLTRRKVRMNNYVLLICGYFLYSWGHAGWAVLLFLLSFFDYFLVKKLFSVSRYKKGAFYFGLFSNIAVWLLFKYSSPLLGSSGFSLGFPLGISFYILRKIAYLIDSYRGKFTLSHDFLEYALYVSFYPQIFSGPIERPDESIRQIKEPRRLDWDLIGRALKLILIGLFNKMVIADNLGMIVDRIFRLDYPSRLMLAAGSLGYAFEIYADFSGYTELSRGFSCLLGFETSQNFNQPYISLTPQDFWNRWHITLSSWLRDYIFYPFRRWVLKLGGNSGRWIANWIVPVGTMLVSGLWHGTGWTFLVWGLYHGILLAACQSLGWNKVKHANLLIRLLSWSFMFVLIVFGWLIFRAPSLAWLAAAITQSQWGASGNQLIALLSVLTMIIIYVLPMLIKLLVESSGKARIVLEPAYYALALAVLVIFVASGLQDFVYTSF